MPIKFLVFGGGGEIWVFFGEGSANFIFMGPGIFLTFFSRKTRRALNGTHF